MVVAIAVKMKAAGSKEGLDKGAKCGMLSAEEMEFVLLPRCRAIAKW